MTELQVTTDLALGGRWTSLRAGEREWLWRNSAVSLAERAAARPGAAFVDAGGGEECFPSVNGDPALGQDHGDVWCRPWVGEHADASARTRDGLTLRRRLGHRDGTVRADYEITGAPGARFLHAVHLLLDVSEAARLRVPGAPMVTLQGERAGTRTRWPDAAGIRLDRLGPDDGTATGAVVASDAVEILDGDRALRLRWGTEAEVPTSFALWRNLRGWPDGSPYRSIGIEPMLGATTSLEHADTGEAVALGPRGSLTWWLEISAA